MLQGVTAKEQRRHPRAQLHLRVRIRWRGPLGSLLEVTQTLDVAREGLLVHHRQECREGSRVWVAFPFDPAASTTVQPETPARVVRVKNTPAGGHSVALHLEIPPRPSRRPLELERRSYPRVFFGLPLLVRTTKTLWPEETMTQDISHSGVRFEAARDYAVGQAVRVQIDWGSWARAGEIPAVVVRVEATAGGDVAEMENFAGEFGSHPACIAAKWEPPSRN